MRYTTPEALHGALDAAADDAARSALLAAVPRSLREQFMAMMTYRKLQADTAAEVAAENAALAAFSLQLDGAQDDEARLAIIEATDRAFLAEWRWHQHATAEDWQRRFLTLSNGPEAAETP